MKRPLVQFALLILTLAIFSPAGEFAVADLQEYEPSDVPPKIRNILFTEKSVGFISQKLGKSHEEYFILKRKSPVLHVISRDLFFKKFRYRADIKPRADQRSFTILNASNGRTYKTKNAYCSEGGHDTHMLWEGERLLEDRVKPCHSVSSVEIVGDQLWLGTRLDGEGGSWPADGIIILSLKDGNLAGIINEENGLSGNLVEVIRIDPYGGKVWVATRTGLSLVNKNGKVESKKYFYEDFKPETGKPVFFLTAEFKESNLLASIARELGVEDTMAYYKAARKIPKEVLSEVAPYSYYMGMFPMHTGFLPKEMNVLVPFYIESAKSGSKDNKSHALRMCAFNDKRAIEYIQAAALANRPGYSIDRCIDTYANLGLLDKSYKLKRKTKLLEKVKKALANIQLGNMHSVWHNTNSAIEATKSLKKMGNLQGFKLMEEYFATFDLKKAAKDHGYLFSANEFYGEIRSRFYKQNNVTPIVLNAIKKGFLRGCEHFDTKNKMSRGEQLDAKYAKTIVISMDLADERPQDLTDYWAGRSVYSNEDINKIEISDSCAAAFRSQIENESVYEDFVNNYYPKLTKRQKELADRLISGKYRPDVKKIRKQMHKQRYGQGGKTVFGGGYGLGSMPPN